MIWRFATFLAMTDIAIASYVAYDKFHVRGRIYPPENLIADTSYGPFLFLLIPLALGWEFVAAKRRCIRVLGVCAATLILLVFAVHIAAIRHPFVDVR